MYEVYKFRSKEEVFKNGNIFLKEFIWSSIETELRKMQNEKIVLYLKTKQEFVKARTECIDIIILERKIQKLVEKFYLSAEFLFLTGSQNSIKSKDVIETEFTFLLLDSDKNNWTFQIIFESIPYTIINKYPTYWEGLEGNLYLNAYENNKSDKLLKKFLVTPEFEKILMTSV